jgi:hypothetical protein
VSPSVIVLIIDQHGILALEFAGSNWTTTFSEKYLSYVFSIGVKYFVLTVILALGADLPTEIQHVFHVMNTQGGYSWITPIEASFMTLVYGVVGLSAPGIAGSMLSGSPSLSTGSFMGAAAGGAGAAMGAAGAAAGVAGLAGSGAAGLAAMAKRLGGGSSAAGGIAGDMGAMGMLGSLAGKNGSASGGRGGVAGLSRALGTSPGGPAGSVGSGARSSGSTVPPAGGAWTVDSAGTARPTPPGGSGPAGGAGPAGQRSAGGPSPQYPFRGPRHRPGVASGGGGRLRGRPRPGTGPWRPEPGLWRHRCRWRGFGGPPGAFEHRSRRCGQYRRPCVPCGVSAVPPGPQSPGAGGADGIADPRGSAPGAPPAGAGAEEANKGFLGRSAAEHALKVAKHASRGLGHAQDALRHQGLSGGINIRLNHPE